MITGVVVPFATVLVRSVPLVPSVNAATLVTVPEAPVKVPADKVKPPATLISSAAPVDAVVLPKSLDVAIVRPLALAYALGAT